MVCNCVALLALVLALAPVQEGASTSDSNALIINPRIMSTVGAVLLHGPNMVRSDSVPQARTGKSVYGPTKLPEPTGPSSLLITGIVPDASKRWVVAVTHDEKEFQDKFPGFQLLLSEGKFTEAGQVLYLERNISVSTKVESFWGGVKTKDMPEEIGSFFLDLGMDVFREHGGCLTFLSFVPRLGDDVVGYGNGIEETVRGVLLIEEHQTADKRKPEYTMQIIKARIMK
jgi:hypothetical protein